MRSGLRVVGSLLLAFAFASSSPVQALPSFSDVYFFGASNLDAGNWENNTNWNGAPFAPVPANGYWQWRWQSGPSWAEYFAQAFGHDAEASENGGTNYAFGAAGTSPHPGEIPAAPGTANHDLYLSTQIDQILADFPGGLDPQALYVFAIGDNDPVIFGRTPADAPDAAGVVVAQMLRLLTDGARNFLVRTLPPGQDPYATPFNQALVDGVEAVRAAGGRVYIVFAADFVANYLTVDHLASIGITQFGPGINCRADAPCQAGATAAALLDSTYDHSFLFFDDVGPHFNHRVHEDIANHALLVFANVVEVPALSGWSAATLTVALATSAFWLARRRRSRRAA